jgi:hypothetical protein
LLHRLRRGSLAGMDFELVGELSDIEIIAVNLSIRDNADLKARYGGRRWRKLKGVGTVRLASGSIRRAEVHWYEAHGVGKRKMKIKRLLD